MIRKCLASVIMMLVSAPAMGQNGSFGFLEQLAGSYFGECTKGDCSAYVVGYDQTTGNLIVAQRYSPTNKQTYTFIRGGDGSLTATRDPYGSEIYRNLPVTVQEDGSIRIELGKRYEEKLVPTAHGFRREWVRITKEGERKILWRSEVGLPPDDPKFEKRLADLIDQHPWAAFAVRGGRATASLAPSAPSESVTATATRTAPPATAASIDAPIAGVQAQSSLPSETMAAGNLSGFMAQLEKGAWIQDKKGYFEVYTYDRSKDGWQEAKRFCLVELEKRSVRCSDESPSPANVKIIRSIGRNTLDWGGSIQEYQISSANSLHLKTISKIPGNVYNVQWKLPNANLIELNVESGGSGSTGKLFYSTHYRTRISREEADKSLQEARGILTGRLGEVLAEWDNWRREAAQRNRESQARAQAEEEELAAMLDSNEAAMPQPSGPNAYEILTGMANQAKSQADYQTRRLEESIAAGYAQGERQREERERAAQRQQQSQASQAAAAESQRLAAAEAAQQAQRQRQEQERGRQVQAEQQRRETVRLAEVRRKADDVARPVEFKEGVVLCQERQQSSVWRCKGPLQITLVDFSNSTSVNTGIGQACGSNSSFRDLGMTSGYRAYGCGFGIHPTARDYPGNTDVPMDYGVSYIPGRQTFYCTKDKLAYCRGSR